MEISAVFMYADCAAFLLGNSFLDLLKRFGHFAKGQSGGRKGGVCVCILLIETFDQASVWTYVLHLNSLGRWKTALLIARLNGQTVLQSKIGGRH